MKAYKILLAALFILFQSSMLFPQSALKKGVYTLNGGILFSSSKITNSFSLPFYETEVTTTQTIFSISPDFGYFVMDNLLIGGSISFTYIDMEQDSPPGLFSTNSLSVVSKQIGIGPRVRYYFSGMSVIPFAGVGYSYTKDFETEREGSQFLGEAGINIFLSNSVALEPFLSYSIGSYSSPFDYDINTFSIGLRISCFIIN